MMNTTLLQDLFGRHRRRMAWWSLAIVCVCGVYVSFYPSVGRSMTDMVDTLPSAMIDAFGYQQIGTARGWLASTVFGVLGSTLMLGFAISTGASIGAGDEEDGTMKLELTAPVTRQQVLGTRIVVLGLWIAVLAAVTVVASWVIATILDMEVPFSAIVAVGGRLVLLSAMFAALTLAIGAATGSRALAAGGASAVAALSFITDALAAAVGWDWLATVSPHAWYGTGEALLVGFEPMSQVAPAALAVALAAAALVGFGRRDLA